VNQQSIYAALVLTNQHVWVGHLTELIIPAWAISLLLEIGQGAGLVQKRCTGAPPLVLLIKSNISNLISNIIISNFIISNTINSNIIVGISISNIISNSTSKGCQAPDQPTWGRSGAQQASSTAQCMQPLHRQ
jgi:hypothetical protein